MIKTKRKIAKQIFSFILALSMMMCGLPSTVFAETTEAGSGEEAVALAALSGEKPSLNIADGIIKISEGTAGNLTVEIGRTTIEYSANEPIVITGTTATNLIAVHSGNPTVVLRDCEIITAGSPLSIQSGSSVNLKLEGNNTLGAGLADAGIHVPSGASVTIDGSGTLVVNGGATAAGIGGREGESGGTITINGGTVKASSYYGAAIGGGRDGKSGGTITINGGTVKASGSYGAGIGGGSEGNSGTILITGGTIEARGEDHGAGIGGGFYGNGENIKITGGKITAYGGDYGAGIGGGRYGSGGEISITGGTVEAVGYYGAGIGGGSEGSGGTITITGGTVEAVGYYGAGIGGGSAGSGGKITIHGGTVSAIGDPYGAGIGGGYTGSGGEITITGGMVRACGTYGAGIGGGERGAGGNVTITGGNVNPNPIYGLGNLIGAGNQALDHGTLTDGNGNRVNAYVLTLDGVTEPVSVTTISGITYGLKDVSTLDNNKLYFYLPDGASVDTITAGGKDYICKDSSSNTYYTAHDWSKKDGVCVRCDSECNHSTIMGGVCDTCGKVVHVHDWNYTVSDGTITAACQSAGCEKSDGGSITLQVADAYYTGNSKEAAVTGALTAEDVTWELTYGDNGETSAPGTSGEHTATLTVYENGTEKTHVTKVYTISYLPAPAVAYQISNGYKDSNHTYWFKEGEDITVSAPEGYTIATSLNGSYGATVTLSETEDKAIYLKNSNGEMTDKIRITETLSLDKTAPVGTITIKERGNWQKLWKKISFGLFYKGDAVAKVTTDDAGSGVKTVEYFLADQDLLAEEGLSDAAAISALENAVGENWTAYSREISLNHQSKNVVYVKITDNVGNVTYISSEGVVLYADATAVTETVITIYKANADKEVQVALNGNKIQAVANGDNILTPDTDYTVNDNIITLKAAYLDTLTAKDYIFTVAYNPLGLDYVEADGNDAPETTTFRLTVEKADGSVTDISDLGKTYDSEKVGNPTYTSLSQGVATFTYKKQGAADDTYTSVAPKDAGDYTVRVTVAADENYKEASATTDFCIAKASITLTVTDAGKVYGENDPDKFAYTVSSGTRYDADALQVNIKREAGEDVNTYTITAAETAGANPNYDITFVAGTFTISKKTLGINWGDTEFTYDGTEKLPTATATGVAYHDAIGLTVTGGETNAGTGYTATVTGITGDKKDNYQLPADVTKSFRIAKAEQNAPEGLDYKAETIDRKEDGYIKNVTGAMEYRKDNQTAYTPVIGVELTDLSDGIYYIRYKASENHAASPDTIITLQNDKKLQVTVPETQAGYTLTVNKTELVWNDSLELTYALKNGYTEGEDFTVRVNGEPVVLNNGKYTVSNVQSDMNISIVGVADVTAPNTEITLGTNKWNQFFHNITFGLFFKETQRVTIASEDKGSGVDQIRYYLSATELSEAEVQALAADQWTEYKGGFDINPQEAYIIYAKATDKTGNTKYISSDKGIVIDDIVPVVSGIADGETHYGDTTFAVSDENLDFVTVDGEKVILSEGKYMIATDGQEHTVEATDKAGNVSAKITIRVVAIDSLDDSIADLTIANVKSSDKQTVERVQSLVNSLLNGTKTFTETEQAKLNEIKTNTAKLLSTLAEVSAEMTDLDTKVRAYDIEKVKSEDKETIHGLIARIDVILNGDNLTATEKESLGQVKATAEGLLKKITDTENENKPGDGDNNGGNQKPENKPDDGDNNGEIQKPENKPENKPANNQQIVGILPWINNLANTNKPASNNQTGNTVKPSNSNPQVSSDKPYIEGKSDQNGWENIEEQLKETTTGATVAMNGTSVVPGTVIDTIKGKDISVVFDLGEGITWTVNGKDITAEQVGDIDFGVTVGAQAGNTIPVDIINELTGERYSMNVSLAYDGEFGFRAILTVNAGKENAGLFANLFYYNPESGALEYICASQIDADGNANLEFTHASDYVVVVDEEDMQATDTDRDDDISATPDEVVSADTEETTAGNSWWFIVIGAIVVIAGVGIFFAAKKKETEK